MYRTVSHRLEYSDHVTQRGNPNLDGVIYASVPITIDGKVMFSIGEALREATVSRATFFRWVKEGVIHDTEFRDRNGRRVFTAEEVEELKRFAQRLVAAPQLRFPLTKA